MKLDISNFANQEKKLKRYYKEQDNFKKIIFYIKLSNSYKELSSSYISLVYGFEKLKYFSKEYYSFNLSKYSGLIRLICSIDKENDIVKLEFISMDHYNDFKRINK